LSNKSYKNTQGKIWKNLHCKHIEQLT